ncbi:MAG: DUF1566 domain-containing protein [Pseudomonadota bacterium]
MKKAKLCYKQRIFDVSSVPPFRIQWAKWCSSIRGNSICILAFWIIVLGGCGGGSEDLLPDRVPQIQVSANVDVSADEQVQIDIEGAALGGQGELVYAWQADEAITITHADTSIANATLTTPIVTTPTEFVVTLVVTDERQVSSEDTFTLIVNPVNLPPIAVISINSLTDYPNGSFPVQAQVVLDGSASDDPDVSAEQVPIVSYRWQQVAGTLLTAIGNVESSSLEFTTPITEQQETVVFELEVTDQEGASTTTEAQIVLLGQSGTLPQLMFNAFEDGFSGERVLLDMTASSDAPDAAPFSYFWQEQSGNFPQLQLESNQQAVTYVTLPFVEQSTELVFEAQISDSFGNAISAEKKLTVHPFPLNGINDTGAIDDTGSGISPGADSDFGRDRAFASGVVTKMGRGINAFDFTRLNNNGDPVDVDTDDWACVRDNLTGLVWEVKTLEVTSLHYANQLFTWYQADFNGNVPGELNLNSTSCNISSQTCNTQFFLNAVNQQGLCGFFDWRIPTHTELQSILHYGKQEIPLVDTDFMPNWGDEENGALWYWTRQSSADGLSSEEARNAWAFDFNSAVDNVLAKSNQARLRLVRAGRIESSE